MKKFMFCAAAGVLLLSGCAAEKTAVVDGGNVRVEGAGIEIDFPESWTVYTGDEMYSLIYERYSDSYSDVKSMKSALKTEGQEYILYALSDSGKAIALVTAQDLTVDSDGKRLDEAVTAADYARSVHDNTIFEYRAGGYITTDSSFGETTLGGKSGWLSAFDVRETEEEEEILLGMSEFMFEQGNDVYSVQFLYSDEESKAQTAEVDIVDIA